MNVPLPTVAKIWKEAKGLKLYHHHRHVCELLKGFHHPNLWYSPKDWRPPFRFDKGSGIWGLEVAGWFQIEDMAIKRRFNLFATSICNWQLRKWQIYLPFI